MTVRGIEGFIQSGSYRELKQLEAKAKILKGMIRDEQSALKRKRMVWKRLRVVGQFQYFSMYEYNQLELNEYLYDLGLLPEIASVDGNLLSNAQVAELKRFCIPGNKYVRYTPNRMGRVDCSLSDDEYKSYFSLPLMNKVGFWRELHERKEALSLAWGNERVLALDTKGFQESSSIPLELGTLSLLTTPVSYRALDVLQSLGPDTLIQCAKVDQEKLDEYAARGYLKKIRAQVIQKVGGCSRKIPSDDLAARSGEAIILEFKIKQTLHVESIIKLAR